MPANDNFTRLTDILIVQPPDTMQYTASHLPAHAVALRKGRVSETGRTYLLTAVTDHRRSLFADWRIGRLVVAEMRAAQCAGQVDSLAWVLIPDHLHWLVTLQQGDLTTLMRQVKSRSAIAVNKAMRQEGRVWQKGYHDHAVRAEEDLRAMARYVVANPLRASLTTSLGDYPLRDAAWL